jgi:hypothetical protein
MPSAVRLREDYSARELRALARRSKDANQSRRLLSLAAVRDGMDRGSAAKIGGMDRQTLRDWVHRFNGSGPEGDRLTRSLADFAKLVEAFDAHGVSFVSVTQSFNTTTSMGRLTLNVLLSFAQFEREVTRERIRDKIAASKKKGMWMGGVVPLGYRAEDRMLHIVEDHAEIVRSLFWRYLEAGSVVRLKQQLDSDGFRLPVRIDDVAAQPVADCSAGGTSTRSSRTRSMSG